MEGSVCLFIRYKYQWQTPDFQKKRKCFLAGTNMQAIVGHYWSCHHHLLPICYLLTQNRYGCPITHIQLVNQSANRSRNIQLFPSSSIAWWLASFMNKNRNSFMVILFLYSVHRLKRPLDLIITEIQRIYQFYDDDDDDDWCFMATFVDKVG